MFSNYGIPNSFCVSDLVVCTANVLFLVLYHQKYGLTLRQAQGSRATCFFGKEIPILLMQNGDFIAIGG